MEYLEITAVVVAADVEPTADILRAVTDRDVWIEAPFTQPDLESDGIIDTTAPTSVHAYASHAAAFDTARQALADAAIAARLTERRVVEEDWAESWKEHFHVERYGGGIVVVPSWRRYAPRAGDAVITLDPGMAFGTGQHETTRMCLEQLEHAVTPGAVVLDLGCGSGILSLAAARLGAAGVVGLDVDPDCARVTNENARANALEGVVRAATGSLGDVWPFPDPPHSRFDVAVANIIARVIVDLAGALVHALKPGGTLIVSGIIVERELAVREALAAAGAHVTATRAMGDWRCIIARRGDAR